jgi:hypothetical protein
MTLNSSNVNIMMKELINFPHKDAVFSSILHSQESISKRNVKVALMFLHKLRYASANICQLLLSFLNQ